MATKAEELRILAQEIKNETQVGANTAERVGTAFEQAANGLDELLQNVDGVYAKIKSIEDAGYIFAGMATPSTNPGTPDGPVFYLASESGTYTNFNATELQAGLSVLTWNGSWSSQQIFSVDDEPTAGSDNLVKSSGVYAKISELSQKVGLSSKSVTSEVYSGAEGVNHIVLENGEYKIGDKIRFTIKTTKAVISTIYVLVDWGTQVTAQLNSDGKYYATLVGNGATLRLRIPKYAVSEDDTISINYEVNYTETLGYKVESIENITEGNISTNNNVGNLPVVINGGLSVLDLQLSNFGKYKFGGIVFLNGDTLKSLGWDNLKLMYNNGSTWITISENNNVTKEILVDITDVNADKIRILCNDAINTTANVVLNLYSQFDYVTIQNDRDIETMKQKTTDKEIVSFRGEVTPAEVPQWRLYDNSWAKEGLNMLFEFDIPEGINSLSVYSMSSSSVATYLFSIKNLITGKHTYTYKIPTNSPLMADDFSHLRITFNTFDSTKVVGINLSVLSDLSNLEFAVNELKNKEDKKYLNALFLGDSYTQTACWVNSILKLAPIKQYLNLGTSSGHLKDTSNDYVSYPRMDRIYQNRLNPNGRYENVNCFSSEVEWFKRLVRGELRGNLYQLIPTAASSSGTINLSFDGIGDYNVTVNSGMSILDICDEIAELDIPRHRLIHPRNQSYVEVECLDNTYDIYPTINATGTSVTRINKRGVETTPFNGEPLHIVFIAGGKNDSDDTDLQKDNYENQIIKKVDNVYYTEYGTTKIGSIYKKVDDSEVDHTCFVGALRYIMEEIHKLYPKAVFVLIGTSNLCYPTKDIKTDLAKDSTEELAASFLSLPYVSWFKDGIANRLFNYPSGDGSQQNPFTSTGSSEDTVDQMHPNDNGGLKLASSVNAKVEELLPYIREIYNL